MWPLQLTTLVYICSALLWTFQPLLTQSVSGLLQFMAAEFHQLHWNLSVPLQVTLCLHPDIAHLPCWRYVHQGSRQNFQLDRPKIIPSLWSTTHRPRRNATWFADLKLLTSPARLANSSVNPDSTAVNFVQHLFTHKKVILSFIITNTLIPHHYSTPDVLDTQYNTCLTGIFNSLAPVKTRSVNFMHSSLRFPPELQTTKANGWQLESR